MELGGLSSPEYLRVNPQGKMPALVVHMGLDTDVANIAESDTISRYLMSAYATTGPSFQPDNPRSNLIARFHDLYLTTIQGCLYKPAPPFGTFGTRQDALLEYQKQLGVIEDYVLDGTMYLCGNEVSYADATLFPSLVFAKYMLPKFAASVPLLNTQLPPKLEAYFERVRTNDPAFAKVYDEVSAR
jgi:glutathione S-transferase